MPLKIGSQGPLVGAWQRKVKGRFASYALAADGGPLKVDEYFGRDDLAVHNEWQRRVLRRVTNDVSDEELAILGLVAPPPAQSPRRFRIQGVGYNTSAFLAPDPQHSYVEMVNEGAAEGMRLALVDDGPKVLITYSGGSDTGTEFLWRWPAERRDEIRMVVACGDPSRRPGPTLLGDNPPGQGISGRWAPEWIWPRYYNFCLPGDMYCCANSRSLQPLFYRILTRAELTFDFAVYLFQVLTSDLGPALLGTEKSDLAGAGGFSSIAAAVTTGATNVVGAQILQPLQLFSMLPVILNSLVSLAKFVLSGDHGKYHVTPAWGGRNGVDKAVQLITDLVPHATVYLFPGTWAPWNAGYPFDIAIRLP